MKTTEDILWKPIDEFYTQRVKLLEETFARYNNKATSESERLQIFNELKQTFYRFDCLNRKLDNAKRNFEQVRRARKTNMMGEIKPHLDQIKMIQRRHGLEDGQWEYLEEC